MGLSGAFPSKHVGPGRKVIAGAFVTVGSANPTVVTGRGFTVVRDGAGIYTVTLRQTPNAIDSIVASAAPKTLATAMLPQEDIDARTTSAFTLHLMSTAASDTADFAVADDAGSRVSFIVVVRDTNVSDP